MFVKIDLTVKLKKDINFRNLPSELSSAINRYFTGSDKLKKFHKDDGFKYYSYGLFTPIKKTGDYHKDECYNLELRFMKMDILNDFFKMLSNIENELFIILDKTFEVVEKENGSSIKELVTLTPAIITINNKNLDISHMDLDLVKENIINNLNKKYKDFHCRNEFEKGQLTDVDFIDDISVTNKSSIVFNYKNGYLIGNKFRIKIKEDILSQNMAFFALGSGLLEKNSLSFGFCEAIY